MFSFSGNLDISKSWMNRALIIQSFDRENFKITGSSSSDDVILLQKALSDLAAGKKEFYAGLGGTTFRFLALRLSREKGEFLLKADAALLARPQKELLNIFSQLGIQAELRPEGLRIQSEGWKEPARTLKVSTSESSQFLSAVLLSSINLDFDLHIMVEDLMISEDYFKFSLQLLADSGIQAVQFEDSIFIRKQQKITTPSLVGEVDVSSVFSLVVAACLEGRAEIKNWKSQTQQPDIQFIHFFEEMGIRFEQGENYFKISKQSGWTALGADLGNCPDLFPVLSVLCAFAQGNSHLFGAAQLKFKESDRIVKTAELLTKCGFKVEALDDGMKIKGDPGHMLPNTEITFDPEHDHRMAMAAALLKLKGFPIHILNPRVINKSYPQFYQHIGLLV